MPFGTASISAWLVGIQVTAGTNTISNNLVGSTTTANSLNAATSYTSTGTGTLQLVTGILSSSAASASITNNTVANLNNNAIQSASNSASEIRGIFASAGVNTITGNAIHDMSTTIASANSTTAQSVYGIIQTSTTAGQTVSQNTVYALVNTAPTSAVWVTGIYYSGPTTGTNIIAQNLVHSLAVSSTSTSSVVNGMQFVAGTFTAQNNMVRVGLDASGASTAGASLVRGIYDNGTDAGRNFYDNSVYVGGTQTSGAANTFAFDGSSGVSNARTYQNNIFVNARSNSGGTGKHYAVSYGGTTPNPTGLTVDRNIFLATGTGGVLGSYNSVDQTTLAGWRSATGQDWASAVVDPLFVNPTGTASTVDLHLQASNPAEGGGVPIAAVTDDYDGQTRSSLTPPDVGADAGNFTVSSDVFPPLAIYSPLQGTNSLANRVLSATITDGVGVSGGANGPRLYYKKSTDADVFGVANDSTGNGWKYVAASSSSSPYSFTIDNSLLTGGGVSLSTTIQYFVAAQDAANNLGSTPGGAAGSGNPPVQNINAHGLVSSYEILRAPTAVNTVGPGGDYVSLTGAYGLFDAINTFGLSASAAAKIVGNLTEDGTNALNQWTETGAGNYTVTIRPDSATLRTISGNVAGGMIRLNGADRVTIDGRFGDSAKWLTFSNTNTAGQTLSFLNDATSNTVEYVTLRGVNASDTSGTVLFGATTGAGGNDNNTIDHADIRDGASTPANGIFSVGSAGTTAQNNSNDTISNSNIFNFYASGAVDAAGVRLDAGNTDWTLTGNSFYQTASRAAVLANVRAIYVNNSSGNNFTVTGNSIGGSQASAGGTAWTTTGTSAAYLFQGIRVNVGTTTPSSVQGNTIQNMVWTSGSASPSLPNAWTGIYVQAGSANVGTTTGNTIGSGAGTGSISVTSAGAGVFGIGSNSSATVAISNNTIGSITANGTTASIAPQIVGIQGGFGTITISGNTIGSTTTANSLNAATSSTSTSAQPVTGILAGNTTIASITNNTVANLNNNYIGTFGSGIIRGIAAGTGVNTIVGNTVRNLSTTSTTTGQSVYGIIDTSTMSGQTVSQNTVYALSNTAPTQAVAVTGIYFAGATSGTNVIARNLVHSLAISSTSATSVVNGMQFDAGTFTAQNNMVRVGLDASGASAATASIIRGIYDNGTDAGRSFYHNSVYLGGTQTSGAANTFAFASNGATNTRDFRNNIFVNARGNSGATGKHYAVNYGGTTTSPTGLTADGNIFLVSGVGGGLGSYNSADRATLAAWQSATGVDGSSYNVDPRFVNPTGTSATVDLHLQTVNPAEAHGVALAAVIDDFDGQTRASYSPSDIGADAGNFTYAVSSAELAPTISFTPLASTSSTTSRTLTAFATITDDVSAAGGAKAPRLYYKKSSDADAFGGNTSADNGWKYVITTSSASPYDFTIDYSLLTGGGASGGDTIQYFVAAQDANNNFVSSPAGAAWSDASSPATTVNAKPGAVQSYGILSTALTALSLSTGTLNPAFAAGTTSYTAGVPFATTTLLVTATPADSTATVTINGGSGNAVALSPGVNTISVLVTASDATTRTYSVSVYQGNTPPTITTNGGGATASVNVPENTTAVTTVQASDAEAPPQTLTYSIVGGADQLKFTIGGTSGALAFLSAPDFENPTDQGADNVYNVTVQASDGFGGTATQAIAVTVTDVVEQVDTTPPVSKVNALPQRASGFTFAVSITASDPSSAGGASGLANTQIWVSDNGAPFALWTTLPAGTTSANYTGQSNHSYAFHSMAGDNAGNTETKPAKLIEASTYIPDLIAPVTAVNDSGVTVSGGTYTIQFSGVDSGGSGLAYFDVYVSIGDGGAPQLVAHVPAGAANNSGAYSGQTTYQGILDGVSRQYRFYTIGIDAAGNVEAAPSAPADVTRTDTFAAPSSLAITNFSVQQGLAERSFIRTVDVTFNQAVASLNFDSTHLVLQQWSLDGTLLKGTVDLTNKVKLTDHVMELDFGDKLGLGGAPSSNNADGYYKLLFVNSNGAGFTGERDFYRLLGDVNGDRGVDGADVAAITVAFGQTGGLNNFDVDGSGAVNALDRTLATRANGRRLGGSLHLD